MLLRGGGANRYNVRNTAVASKVLLPLLNWI